MRSRASRTFPRRDVQQKRGFGSLSTFRKRLDAVGANAIRRNPWSRLLRFAFLVVRTAKTSFLLHTKSGRGGAEWPETDFNPRTFHEGATVGMAVAQ